MSVFSRPMSVTLEDNILDIRMEGRSIENGPHWLWWVIIKVADETIVFHNGSGAHRGLAKSD